MGGSSTPGPRPSTGFAEGLLLAVVLTWGEKGGGERWKEREREAALASSYKDLNPITKALVSRSHLILITS